MLMMECEDVRFIGISGMGGIGKTTIARAIFDRFAHQFEGACFVANIKENQAKQGLLSLQKTLLSKVLTIESVNLADEYGGIDIIRRRLGFKKVLVVLDDVDHQDQLDGLAGAHDWFGKYSRVIITARDEHLLLNCDDTYRVRLLAIDEASRLFSWHAFRKTSPVNGFELFSHRVVQYAGGLPLALKVLGSFLRGRNIKQWRSALDTLQDIPNDEIISKLKISYDGLGDKEKQVFLDLACSFVTSDAATLKKLFTEIIIDILVEKSLLFVSSFGRIGIHDLIREMGRRIAVQENPRRRMWLHEDIADILSEHTGREAIEVILIPLLSNSEENTIHLSNEVFRHMKRLRIFVSSSHENVMYFCSHDPIKFLPNSLCWINWSYYSSPSLPENFEPPKLVGLIMHCSYVVNLWKGSKRLNRLIILDLRDSRKLIQVSDLSGSPNLELIFLCRCVRLVEVHPSVGALKKLTIINVEGCEKLERLPTMFQSGSLELLNFSGCRGLRKVPEIQQNVNRLTEFKQPNFGVLELTSSFLSYLDLSGCSNIETLPSSMCRLKYLKRLYLNRCTKLKNLPEDICELVNLERLDASETSIWCTPNSITCLRKLKYLSFRKVPKAFHVSDLCSWGCFAQLDLKFQLPSVLSVFCTLTRLDLSACNLFDGSIPDDLGCLTSLLELNLSRNNFTFLPKSIVLLNRLRHLDITYCEKLTELPPHIMKLFLDERFALESIPTLPTMYKQLYLVSFANQKLQEMWCASHRESSGSQIRYCLRKNMKDMLEDILLPFLSIVQLQLVWKGSRLGLNFKVGTPVEFQEWLVTWILSAPENEDISFSLAVLWAIWKHRNKLVHERAVFVPSEVISTAIKEHARFPYSVDTAIRELSEVHSGTIVDLNAFNVDSDVQLDGDVVVMEVKGAWKEGQEWAGMAWIAYWWKSRVKVAEARRLLKVISELHAEVHAFVHAVKWSFILESPIVILSENQILIKELHNSDCCSDQDIVCMLHDCLKFMEANKISWKVVKVPSYAVSAAKRAAKMAMKTHMDVLNWVPTDI